MFNSVNHRHSIENDDYKSGESFLWGKIAILSVNCKLRSRVETNPVIPYGFEFKSIKKHLVYDEATRCFFYLSVNDYTKFGSEYCSSFFMPYSPIE